MTRKECIDGMQRIIDEDQNKILVRVHVGYLIHAVKYLKDQPEIIQCKDCKYWEEYHKWVRPEGGSYIAPKCNRLMKRTRPTWFCADGSYT